MHNDRHLSAELMQSYLDGEVSDVEATRVRSHTTSCARCRSEMDAWQTLFGDLGTLSELSPPAHFAGRVLAALPAAPERVPLLARLRRRLPGRLGVAAVAAVRPVHPNAGSLQDFLEGQLPRPDALRVETHLHGCRACRAEVEAWRGLLVGLDGLPTLAPSPELSERVMAHVRVLLAVSAARPTTAERFQRAASRVTPRTRRRMAALAGAGVAPAATLALIAYAVLSHPLVTPSSLLSFLWLRGSERAGTLADGVLGRLASNDLLVTVGGTADLVMSSPGSAAIALAGLAGLTMSATWVLYRNVLAHPQSGRSRVR